MWFFKDGIFGSTPCLLLICYFISILISRKQKLFISFYFLILFLALTYIQFTWPEYVLEYPSPIAQYLSLFFSFLLAALLSAFIMVMIRNNDAALFKRLEENQNKVEEKYQLSTQTNEKLNELIQQKDQLLSIISHDSRAPIKNIESLLEMLILGDISQNEMMALLPSLREQVKETSLFMDNLLIWIKTQKEGFKPKLKRINVAAFLLKIQNLYQTGAELKEIKLTIENKVPGDLIIEDQMLHMILRNLVNNAVKFCPKKSEVIIKSKVTQNYLTLTVKDNGPGMTDEKVQELLSQKENNLDIQNGLGLILVKEFVLLNNGKFNIKSHLGFGSEFIISMPI